MAAVKAGTPGDRRPAAEGTGQAVPNAVKAAEGEKVDSTVKLPVKVVDEKNATAFSF